MKVSLPSRRAPAAQKLCPGLGLPPARPPRSRGDPRRKTAREIEGRVRAGTERRAVLLGRPRKVPAAPGELGSRADRGWALLSGRRRLGGGLGAPAYSASPSQVLLGAAAMGEPVLGAGDQPLLLPRPPGAAAQVPAPEAGSPSPLPGRRAASAALPARVVPVMSRSPPRALPAGAPSGCSQPRPPPGRAPAPSRGPGAWVAAGLRPHSE